MNESLLLIVAAGTILSLAYLLRVIPRQRRAAAVRRAAARLGLAYCGDGDPFASEADFPRRQLPLLWNGSGDQFRNVMRGRTAAGAAVLFDHAFRELSEDTERDMRRHTVAAFHLPGAGLPAFTIAPNGPIERIAGLLGRQQLGFAVAPDFARAHELRGQDEAAIRALFDDASRWAWQSLPPGDGWAADGCGDWLLLRRHADVPLGYLEPSAELGAFLQQAEFFAVAVRERAAAVASSVGAMMHQDGGELALKARR